MRILFLFICLVAFNKMLVGQQNIEDDAWEKKCRKAELYSDNLDSLDAGLRLIDECITYYAALADHTEKLLWCYEIKIQFLEEQDKFMEVLQYLHLALDLTYSLQDREEIIDQEWRLGNFILNVFSDSLKGVTHLNKSLELAIEDQNWWMAYENNEYLTRYYIKKRNFELAKQHARSALDYSLKLETTTSDRYDGYATMTMYFLGIKDYDHALESALFCFNKASEMDDVDLVQTSSCLLTEIYWHKNRLDSASFYMMIAAELMQNDHEYFLRDYFHWASNIYEAKAMYSEAFEALEIFNAYQKKHLAKELIFAKEKALYDQKTKDQALEQAHIDLNLSLAQKKAQLHYFLILSVGLSLLLLFCYSLLLYKKHQQEKKINKNLAASHEIILNQKERLLDHIKTLKTNLVEKSNSYYFTQSAIQLNFEEILFLESSNNYVLIHTLDRQQPLLERIKMIDLIKNFPSEQFIRIHRSYYINKNHIEARTSKYFIEMSNQVTLKASRNYVANLDAISLLEKID